MATLYDKFDPFFSPVYGEKKVTKSEYYEAIEKRVEAKKHLEKLDFIIYQFEKQNDIK